MSTTQIDLVDEAHVAELLELGQSIEQPLMENLLEKFKSDFPAHVSILRKAFDERNFILMERTAHTLKGSAGALGISHVRAACEVLEHTLHEAPANVKENMIAEVESRFPASIGELEKFIAKSQAAA